MADGIRQLGAVQRVEVKLIDTVLAKPLHLLDRHMSGDHAAGLGIFIETLEASAQPVRNGRAAALGKSQHLRKSGDRQNPRNDARGNTGGCAAIAIAQEHLRIEKELRDGAGGARIDLALEVGQVGLDAARFRMAFRIRSHRNLELTGALQAAHQVRCVCEPAGVRLIAATAPASQSIGPGAVPEWLRGRCSGIGHRGIAPQRDEMPHTAPPIVSSDTDDFFAGSAHAGEVRCDQQIRFTQDPHHQIMGSRAGRAVGAIRHGNESRPQRRQALDGRPQLVGHRGIARREELEGHGHRFRHGFSPRQNCHPAEWPPLDPEHASAYAMTQDHNLHGELEIDSWPRPHSS